MKSSISMRARVARFLGERYVHRERPGYFAELVVFAVIVIIAAWPMILLAQAMATLR